MGQIANSAAMELDKQCKAQVYCLAGVAAQIPGMVDSEKSADRIIAIDGCSVGCAMEGLSRAGVPIHQSVMVTELEIKRK